MNAADGLTPDGRCRWCNALVERIDAHAVERDVHHLTGWVHVRGILYQLAPCGCVYGWDPDGQLRHADVDQVDLVAELPAAQLPAPRPQSGRHRKPEPPRRRWWPAARRA